MGKVITFGIQKGGSSKSTSSCITAYLLSQNHKVLMVDMDSQGNATELVTNCEDIYDYTGYTILEAIKEVAREEITGEKADISKYIHKVNDNLDVMTAEDLLATFSRFIYTEYKGKNHLSLLSKTLERVKDNYDYIVIDTAPALGDATLNALTASDKVVIMFEPSKFCYNAVPRFIETVEIVKENANPNLDIAGILTTIVDARRMDGKVLLDLMQEEYGDLLFATTIKRRATTGRISISGFIDNPELEEATADYKRFVKELLERV
jgi:chromosome partitioning protein